MQILEHNNQKVTVDKGELVGYEVNGHEYIHQKGSPGWRNADTEMFPIIGPTAEARFQVQTPKDIAIQDQHGLLREMEYELTFESATELKYGKTYTAGTQVGNSKYPNKSDKQFLYWPYAFQFEKKIRLLADALEITFTISGERDTPFMLGYHPAFKLHGENVSIKTGERTIALDEVLAVGSRALEVPNCNSVVLQDTSGLSITTEGFKGFMLWTEVRNMVCIEPITFYPYAVPQHLLHEGFDYILNIPKRFTVKLRPEPQVA
ncbi:aldose 1-epimerase [Maribacter sp. 2-571]|uniref:aldose epimerase family protein n=1 Tax=Maribacter sp. 2-571 TaxID=3417569 RepID=UPI003D326D01